MATEQVGGNPDLSFRNINTQCPLMFSPSCLLTLDFRNGSMCHRKSKLNKHSGKPWYNWSVCVARVFAGTLAETQISVVWAFIGGCWGQQIPSSSQLNQELVQLPPQEIPSSLMTPAPVRQQWTVKATTPPGTIWGGPQMTCKEVLEWPTCLLIQWPTLQWCTGPPWPTKGRIW